MPEQPTPIRPWFVFLCMGLSAFIAWSVTDHVKGRQMVALQDTLSAERKEFGKATQAQGHVVDAKQLAFRVAEVLSPELVREVSRQGGRIVGTIQATGTVPATALPLQPVVLEAPGQVVTVPQDRGGLPSLTAATFSFDPAAGLSVGWLNRQETFKLGFASWRTGGDGLRAAARLSREVDGQTEEIPLTAADAYLSKDDIQRVAPVWKWGVGAGVGRDALGRTRPNFLFSRALSRNDLIQTGFINGGSVVIYTHTFGSLK